jgi:6-pyruvoyltetrahydropterin/6-carboxytetrahydropterin synthase
MESKNHTIIELFREDMKFSAAHFTIFSETEREHLHGHNFHVSALIGTPIKGNDLAFDYTCCRKEIMSLCRLLNEKCLIPDRSSFLKVIREQDAYKINFGKDKFLLPVTDVILLPLENITTEGLAKWFVEQIANNPEQYHIHEANLLTIKVSTAPGQYASVSSNLREVL